METLTSFQFLSALGLTLFAGLATGLGALLTFLSKAANTKFLSVGLGFSAGVMIYISFVDILTKSQDAFASQYGSLMGESLGLLAFFSGILFTFIIDQLIPDNVNPHHALEFNAQHPSSQPLQHDALSRAGAFTAIAIAIHNFPEGFATFVMALEDINSGIAVAFAIALHNIPEGLAIALPIYYATKKRKKAFTVAFASGLTEPVGAVLGYMLLAPLMGELTLGITFGFVAGIMVYISFDELLPTARRYGNDHTVIVGVVLGMFVMALSLILFKL
ncbi:MAG TPA: zinc transporter ZupT [Sulfurovum sp.]|nr:MAG: zinc transporter ZupT [Sulfurovum sp. 35-42-20]OYZ23679.1 MAG: zinc transporter ZupT [Sulfurovum sp. 16-42-52]OYZ48118.1 MAG: zinc transporter ZupT [Sulfurovum sp. 24-42-9]OZA42976.1 MAG: zinc transporter ZupT [Sulfurovum sp. 17-42-90]OZA61002.1 MAG: zinc transporter ZupT [Sulfurovum sp. 39-42-12]HQR73048.1 zinc transporter ZupT [Sulfurovum sp.]